MAHNTPLFYDSHSVSYFSCEASVCNGTLSIKSVFS